MQTLKFDLQNPGKPFKCLNATNGGPWHKRHSKKQYRSNFDTYQQARIPYSRNHDSASCHIYGGPFSHDISRLFPDFNADPYAPESYDFACTDESILVCLEAGTQTFFRLGETIEHHIKKHHTLPPADFEKWAVICEHIIRHYNEGWADGHHLNIQYWEIWNEPELDDEDAPDKRTWGGTQAQFFDLFSITAKHLKTCFPDLKIGGPGLARKVPWAEEFLREMQNRQVPIDFFSWHIYVTGPEKMLKKAEALQELLEKYGYGDAENILDEWNYVKGWTEEFSYSVQAIHGLKNASFILACMAAAQDSPIDMLMYYDTRPSAFNGIFDFYTYVPLKGYYALYWYGKFYDMCRQIPAENTLQDIYALCGTDVGGKILAVVTHYTDDDDAPARTVTLDFGRKGNFRVYLLDSDHDGELVATTDDLTFELPVHTAILLQEV